MQVTNTFAQQLSESFPLSNAQVAFYRENGYIKLSYVLMPEVLQHYRDVISKRVAELSADAVPLEHRHRALVPGVRIGDTVASPLNPGLYSTDLPSAPSSVLNS